MKTKLPKEIKTVEQAKAFLAELYNNHEAYHPEDDANDVIWTKGIMVSHEEGEQLNKLMDDIYSLDGQEGHLAKVFCPCEFLLMLDPDYRRMMEEQDDVPA